MCIVLHDVILWKNEKFTLTEKKFRQINYLVTLLVKPLLSRNFCQKWVRVNFCNFHTVDVQIFLAKLLLSRIFCQKCDNLNFFNFHTFTIFFSREKEWKQLGNFVTRGKKELGFACWRLNFIPRDELYPEGKNSSQGP